MIFIRDKNITKTLEIGKYRKSNGPLKDFLFDNFTYDEKYLDIKLKDNDQYSICGTFIWDYKDGLGRLEIRCNNEMLQIFPWVEAKKSERYGVKYKFIKNAEYPYLRTYLHLPRINKHITPQERSTPQEIIKHFKELMNRIKNEV